MILPKRSSPSLLLGPATTSLFILWTQSHRHMNENETLWTDQSSIQDAVPDQHGSFLLRGLDLVSFWCHPRVFKAAYDDTNCSQSLLRHRTTRSNVWQIPLPRRTLRLVPRRGNGYSPIAQLAYRTKNLGTLECQSCFKSTHPFIVA